MNKQHALSIWIVTMFPIALSADEPPGNVAVNDHGGPVGYDSPNLGNEYAHARFRSEIHMRETTADLSLTGSYLDVARKAELGGSARAQLKLLGREIDVASIEARAQYTDGDWLTEMRSGREVVTSFQHSPRGSGNFDLVIPGYDIHESFEQTFEYRRPLLSAWVGAAMVIPVCAGISIRIEGQAGAYVDAGITLPFSSGGLTCGVTGFIDAQAHGHASMTAGFGDYVEAGVEAVLDFGGVRPRLELGADWRGGCVANLSVRVNPTTLRIDAFARLRTPRIGGLIPSFTLANPRVELVRVDFNDASDHTWQLIPSRAPEPTPRERILILAGPNTLPPQPRAPSTNISPTFRSFGY